MVNEPEWRSIVSVKRWLPSRFILEVEPPGVAVCFHRGRGGGEGKRGIMEDA